MRATSPMGPSVAHGIRADSRSLTARSCAARLCRTNRLGKSASMTDGSLSGRRLKNAKAKTELAQLADQVKGSDAAEGQLVAPVADRARSVRLELAVARFSVWSALRWVGLFWEAEKPLAHDVLLDFVGSTGDRLAGNRYQHLRNDPVEGA